MKLTFKISHIKSMLQLHHEINKKTLPQFYLIPIHSLHSALYISSHLVSRCLLPIQYNTTQCDAPLKTYRRPSAKFNTITSKLNREISRRRQAKPNEDERVLFPFHPLFASLDDFRDCPWSRMTVGPSWAEPSRPGPGYIQSEPVFVVESSPGRYQVLFVQLTRTMS